MGLERVKYLLTMAGVCAAIFATSGKNMELPALRNQGGTLTYLPDSLGNTLPDYSFCGYLLSEFSIPEIEAEVYVPLTTNDATQAIQAAINYVSKLPVQKNGFRGAVLLEEGTYSVQGRLKITDSGVVLRGSGKGTILKAIGVNRETLIRVVGSGNDEMLASTDVVPTYVPVGATAVTVKNAAAFSVGDKIKIHMPSTQKWINSLGMVDYGGETGWLGWKPGQRDVIWERKITGIQGHTLLINIPLTMALDPHFGTASVTKYTWPGRIAHVGVENLVLVSDFNPDNRKDESHCWFAITMEHVENAWVRQVEFKHFAGSAVALYESASRVTVEDCISTQPISEIAGQRRNTFFNMGQQNLFLRCYAENGNHDFATGFCAAGPNAFVQCESYNAHNFSGTIDSWATGVLYDIVTADGQALSFSNRGQNGQGVGWTAANSMFWNCSAGRIECFAPPGAQNYAYGAWAQFAGNGHWHDENSHISPRSLFFAQLAGRLKKSPADYQQEYLPFGGESTSSPTIEQAAAFTRESTQSPLQLKTFIQQAATRNAIPTLRGKAISVNTVWKPEKKQKPEEVPSVNLTHGWLTFHNGVLTGYQLNVPWWRGNPRPFATAKASPAITRYVPGRVGHGYTDELDSVVTFMKRNHIAAVYHNYGLWYDRRRDDHERIKRYDSESWAPFYEQPFERSGQGEAWDRLSKYDLTRYNPWYWNRLKTFADLAEKEGKLMLHQHYFQHNILEAGAHWTDSPWRPANNINQTGFPEPPPYSGDKRIYLAEQFYDISHPERKELHRAYIRQCLHNFSENTNVLQSISAEYTGPLHFVEFWLDVIQEWEAETGKDARVCLSTTKDVQDAILNDEKRASLVDVIDIRYWGYRPDSSVYAPPGGVNMAPRQHARKVKPGKRSSESVYRAVSEYRIKYPNKAVCYSEGHYTDFGWAIFMAGGSMAPIKVSLPEGLLLQVSSMHPVAPASADVWKLEEKGRGMVFYNRNESSVALDLSAYKGQWLAEFIHPDTGQVLTNATVSLKGGQIHRLTPPPGGRVIWVHKK